MASRSLLQLPKRDWHVVRHGSHYHQVHLARQGACACGDPHQVSARDTMVTVAITAPQSQAGVREPGLQRLGTNPSRVPSLGPGMPHVAVRSSQAAASLHVSEEQAVKERKKTSWRYLQLHRRF